MANKKYDENTDYQAHINDAEARGDYASAAKDEKMRNDKIGGMGLSYSPTFKYNYNDIYRGEADSAQRELKDYNEKGFSYDYETDPRYKQLLENQKKEADTLYNNGIAELSGRFDGDIPAGMVAQMLNQKQAVIDKADSYIPELWRLAQEKWMDEGQLLRDNYNIAENKRAEDYNKFLSERDFYISGIENAENRRRYNQEYADNMERYDREYADNKEYKERAYAEDVRRYEDDKAYKLARDSYDDNLNTLKYALSLVEEGYASSIEEAIQKVKRYTNSGFFDEASDLTEEKAPLKAKPEAKPKETPEIKTDAVFIRGIGRLSQTELRNAIKNDEIGIEKNADGKVRYFKKG